MGSLHCIASPQQLQQDGWRLDESLRPADLLSFAVAAVAAVAGRRDTRGHARARAGMGSPQALHLRGSQTRHTPTGRNKHSVVTRKSGGAAGRSDDGHRFALNG